MLVKAMQARGKWLAGSLDTNAAVDPGFQGKAAGVQALLAAAAAGKGFLASDKPGTANAPPAVLLSQLAAFLVGAGTNCFFGGGSWTANHTSREGVTWYPEYDRPLGPPLGPANKSSDGTLTRRFQSGTVAVYHPSNQTGTVAFAAQ
jgi:hypothetical protein